MTNLNKDLLREIKADTDGIGAYIPDQNIVEAAQITELVKLGYIDSTDPTAISITPEGRKFLGEQTKCVECRYNSWLYDKKDPPPEPCNMFKIKITRTLTGCNQGAWK